MNKPIANIALDSSLLTAAEDSMIIDTTAKDNNDSSISRLVDYSSQRAALMNDSSYKIRRMARRTTEKALTQPSTAATIRQEKRKVSLKKQNRRFSKIDSDATKATAAATESKVGTIDFYRVRLGLDPVRPELGYGETPLLKFALRSPCLVDTSPMAPIRPRRTKSDDFMPKAPIRSKSKSNLLLQEICKDQEGKKAGDKMVGQSSAEPSREQVKTHKTDSRPRPVRKTRSFMDDSTSSFLSRSYCGTTDARIGSKKLDSKRDLCFTGMCPRKLKEYQDLETKREHEDNQKTLNQSFPAVVPSQQPSHFYKQKKTYGKLVASMPTLLYVPDASTHEDDDDDCSSLSMDEDDFRLEETHDNKDDDELAISQADSMGLSSVFSVDMEESLQDFYGSQQLGYFPAHASGTIRASQRGVGSLRIGGACRGPSASSRRGSNDSSFQSSSQASSRRGSLASSVQSLRNNNHSSRNTQNRRCNDSSRVIRCNNASATKFAASRSTNLTESMSWMESPMSHQQSPQQRRCHQMSTSRSDFRSTGCIGRRLPPKSKSWDSSHKKNRSSINHAPILVVNEEEDDMDSSSICSAVHHHTSRLGKSSRNRHVRKTKSWDHSSPPALFPTKIRRYSMAPSQA